MAVPEVNVGQELLNVPMGDMIREMAFAIADAQIRLDENSIEVAEMMGGLKTIVDKNGAVTFEDSRVFFGNENVTLADAVSLHNTTIDGPLKIELASKFVTNGEFDLFVDVDPNDSAKFVVVSPELNDLKIILIPKRLSMMELGFAPTFYQFVDTIIEVKISITYTRESSSGTSVKIANTNKAVSYSGKFSFKRGAKATLTRNVNVTTTQVNAAYANKYSYRAEGSSVLRTKLVPIPPPAVLEERIRQLIETENPKPDPASAPPVSA
jgi:hypothetical protein